MRSELASFLAYYDAAHRNRANRCVHHVAHAAAVAGVLVLSRSLIGLALIGGSLLLSWLGHYVFERNTPAFFDASPRRGILAGVIKKLEVALGGVLWSGACFLRLFGVGPLGRL